MLYRTTGLGPVFGLRREIDRLFEDTFGRGGAGASGWTPAVDVREDSQEISMAVELPGIDPSQVDISVDNGVLSVRGEKHEERKEQDEQGQYHIVERNYGSFTRSFQLPQGVDEQQITANFDRGVLHVHIPKAALPQPRKIQIGGTGQQQQVQGESQGQPQQVTSGQTQEQRSGRGSGSRTSAGTGSGQSSEGSQQREPKAAKESSSGSGNE